MSSCKVFLAKQKSLIKLKKYLSKIFIKKTIETQINFSKKMNRKKKIDISKIITSLLRHRAKKRGVPIDDEGFISVKDTLDFVRSQVNQKLAEKIDFKLLKEIVAEDKKGRMFLDEERMCIRANQGHSQPVDNLKLRVIKVSDPGYDLIVHGTYQSNKELILKSGCLKRMSRNHLHMTNVTFGEDNRGYKLMRYDVDMYVVVNMRQAIKDGIPFYESANKVVLTDHDIPLKYLTFLDRAHNKIPCLGVIVYGYDKEGMRYLSMVRSNNNNWSYPKGKKNKDEKSIETALRELREETGLREKDLTFLQHELLVELSNSGKPATAYYVARYNKTIDPMDLSLELEDLEELSQAQWILEKNILTWTDTPEFGKLRPRRQELCKLVQFV